MSVAKTALASSPLAHPKMDHDLSTIEPPGRHGVGLLHAVMSRHVSGTFERVDRVRARPGRTVSLRADDRRSTLTVQLIELSLSHAIVASELPFELGTEVGVSIALHDRHLEFELPAVVSWHGDGELALAFEYLSARQSYGLVLALELERQALRVAPKLKRVAQR